MTRRAVPVARGRGRRRRRRHRTARHHRRGGADRPVGLVGPRLLVGAQHLLDRRRRLGGDRAAPPPARPRERRGRPGAGRDQPQPAWSVASCCCSAPPASCSSSPPASALPSVFVVVVATAWGAYRFGPPVAALACLGLSSLTLAAATLGGGPFAGIDNPLLQVGFVQTFCGLCAVLAMLLALGSAEQQRLTGALTQEAGRAQERLQLFESLSASTTDAVTVVDSRRPGGVGQRARRQAAPRVDSLAEWALTDLDGLALEHDRLPHRRALAGSVVTHERVVRPAPTPGGQRVVLSVSANGLVRLREPHQPHRGDGAARRHHRRGPPPAAPGVRGGGGPRPARSADQRLGVDRGGARRADRAPGAPRRRGQGDRPRAGAQRAGPGRRPHGPHERADRGPAAARPGPRRLPGSSSTIDTEALVARGGRAPRRPRPGARRGARCRRCGATGACSGR